MYRVLRFFRDIQDNNHAYHVGDEYPHGGMAVTEKRLLELSTDKNRRHMPLIAKVEIEPVELEPVENRAEVAQEEPVEGFMNPPEEAEKVPEKPKPTKKRGRPRNDAK